MFRVKISFVTTATSAFSLMTWMLPLHFRNTSTEYGVLCTFFLRDHVKSFLGTLRLVQYITNVQTDTNAFPESEWIKVTPPDMLEHFRKHQARKLHQEQPIYNTTLSMPTIWSRFRNRISCQVNTMRLGRKWWTVMIELKNHRQDSLVYQTFAPKQYHHQLQPANHPVKRANNATVAIERDINTAAAAGERSK